MLKWYKNQHPWQQPFFSFYCFLLRSVANMAVNCVCIKQISKFFGYNEICCVVVAWYMGSTHCELKTHRCV